MFALHFGLSLGKVLLQVRHSLALLLVLHLEAVAVLRKRVQLRLHGGELRLLLLALALQLIPLLRELLDHLLLADADASALLHQHAEVGDLLAQLRDRLPSADLLLVRQVHHLPGLLDVLLQRLHPRLVLLRQFESRLHLGGIVDDLGVELPTLPHESLLLVVGLFQGPVQLLVLDTEPLQVRVAHQVRHDLLELPLNLIDLRGAQLAALDALYYSSIAAAQSLGLHCRRRHGPLRWAVASPVVPAMPSSPWPMQEDLDPRQRNAAKVLKTPKFSQ
eukprot:scaffold5136_cov229-Pinguiococcus_pyrenoidosus.AAC.3